MKLVEVERSEFKKMYKRTKLYTILDDFSTLGIDCARVEGAPEHYRTLNVAANTINKAIKHFNFCGIKAVVCKGEVYLMRTDGDY